MRIPGSLNEYEHILNASGWSQLGIRKRGTVMRRTRSEEFLGGYRELIAQRIAYLQDRIKEQMRLEENGHPLLGKQREIVGEELARRFQQLAEEEAG